MAQAFGELRDAVFAKVAQRSIRLAGLSAFRHLHRLSLRFHQDRKTGGVSRAIERGTKGIEFVLAFMVFNILPTLLEIVLVCGVLWALYSVWFALVTFVTIGGYIAWTLAVTEWRTKFRRVMNENDRARPAPRPSTACSTSRPSSTSATRTTRRGASTWRSRATSRLRSRAGLR